MSSTDDSGVVSPRPDKDLLTAWMLLLLDVGVGYGYRLRRELESHGLDIDPGAMYRRLRQLEHDGFVQSSWQASSSGPQRRAYRLTAKGKRLRDAAAGVIAVTRETHDVFLEAYERHGRSRPRKSEREAAPVGAAVGEPQAVA